MSGFTNSEEQALKQALRDVPIPSGLEARLLASVTESRGTAAIGDVSLENRENTQAANVSRRGWILAAAATVGGIAVTGDYLFAHRRLEEPELVAGIDQALAAKEWLKTWRSMAKMPVLTLPRSVRRPRHWQPIETELASGTIAFDVTQAGRPPAVLFAVPTDRGISHFPDAVSIKPQVVRSGQAWQYLSYWQDPSAWNGSKVLFVLASTGTARDFRSLLTTEGTTRFA